MSTAMAFLSGKGGSGKTTLALSVACLLSGCGIRVLLVDCDLSTNGATYFYESRLGNSRPLAFCDILDNRKYRDMKFLSISPNYDFMPSVPQFSERYVAVDVNRKEDYRGSLEAFCVNVKAQYDVVLFDCQAGYTSLLRALLPLMDVDLFVLEADGISASAMRSLHLKIGDYLGHAKLYQVFNKATEEEYEIYSKIVGTFFTNIGTLLFDWKIRQAFSRTQVPDMENTGAKYGSDLCGICKIIFTDEAIQKKLEAFSAKLSYNELSDERAELLDSLDALVAKQTNSSRQELRRRMLRRILVILFVILCLFAFWLLETSGRFLTDSSSSSDIAFAITAALSSVLLASMWFLIKGEKNEDSQLVQQRRSLYENRIRKIDTELAQLARKMKFHDGYLDSDWIDL